jgi:hypothetical protein
VTTDMPSTGVASSIGRTAQPPALPPAIASHEELAATLRSKVWRGSAGKQLDRERLMAGLMTMVADDPERVAALLAAAAGRHLSAASDRQAYLADLPEVVDRDWPKFLLISGNPKHRHQSNRFRRDQEAIANGERPARLRRPVDLVHLIGALRLSELRAGLETKTRPPVLLATPTDASGSVDPEVLLDRIAVLESAGRQPWPLDLEQALLRLPRQTDPALLARAAQLRSPAGIAIARWLAAGPPADPVATVIGEHPGTDLLANWSGNRQPRGLRSVALTLSEQPRSGLHALLFTTFPRDAGYYSWISTEVADALVLPHHREVTAAWTLTGAKSVLCGRLTGPLPSGTETGGPAGPALTLLLAYVLGADRVAARMAGTDAIVSLATAGNLDPGALGDHLGALIADGTVVLSRVVPPLAAAARAGAMAATWDVVAAMLPHVLRAKKAGLSDLLALGAETATAVGSRDVIPALAQLAARTDSSQMGTQARRLQQVLTRP